MPSSSSVSVRRSIRWLPGEATEPTHTIVLTGGETGVFLDVRFLKDSNDLDWAFAGYRHQISDETVKFTHHIDSRTLTPLEVKDFGKNSVLENGQTLESGEMVNPESGQITPYEEIWEDIEAKENPPPSIFIRNASGTKWRAWVGDWQLGLGRDKDGIFWAWQAVNVADKEDPGEKMWKVIYTTSFDQSSIVLLPGDEIKTWGKGTVEWNGDLWQII